MSMDMAQIQKIRDAITHGTITPKEVERRLEEAIDAACESDHADPRFIEACEDLLWEINTAGTQTFESRNDQYLEALGKQVRPKRFPLSIPAPAIRLAALAVAMIAVMVCIVDPPAFSWLEGCSTVDEQQYVIQGNQVTIEIVARSLAEERNSSVIVTDDWAEMTDFLGFVPSIPDTAALGLNEVMYKAYVEPSQITLCVKGRNQSVSATLVSQYFTDAQDAYFSMEQNATGEEVSFKDHKVYVTENTEMCSYYWADGCATYFLSGNFPEDVGHALLTELMGE